MARSTPSTSSAKKRRTKTSPSVTKSASSSSTKKHTKKSSTAVAVGGSAGAGAGAGGTGTVISSPTRRTTRNSPPPSSSKKAGGRSASSASRFRGGRLKLSLEEEFHQVVADAKAELSVNMMTEKVDEENHSSNDFSNDDDDDDDNEKREEKNLTTPTTKKKNDSERKEEGENDDDNDDDDADQEEEGEGEEEPAKKKTKKVSPSSSVRKDSTPSKKKETSSNNKEEKQKKNPPVTKTMTKTKSKAKPTFDVHVHRLRHLDYRPAEVLAMVALAGGGGKVAISRSDGSIELWQVTTRQVYPTAATARSTSSSAVKSEQASSGTVAPNPSSTTNTGAMTPSTRISGTSSSSLAPQLYPLSVIPGRSSGSSGGSNSSKMNNMLAAHSICWVHPPATSSASQQQQQQEPLQPLVVAANPYGSLWLVDFSLTSQSNIHVLPNTGGGAIFALTSCKTMKTPVARTASSPTSSSSSSSVLPGLVAAACQDGSVRIYQVKWSTSAPTTTSVDDDDDDTHQQDNEKATTSTTTPRIVEPPLVTLPTAGAAILSLTWRVVSVEQQDATEQQDMDDDDDDDEDMDDDGDSDEEEASSSNKNRQRQRTYCYHTHIFAGVADGTIRKYILDLNCSTMTTASTNTAAAATSTSTSTSVSNIITHKSIWTIQRQKPDLRITLESKGAGKFTNTTVANGNNNNNNRKTSPSIATTTKVWTIELLSDGTLVSGNSLGQIQFWSSTTGTLQQATIMQSNMKTDVLQLSYNEDETKVFATGVDSRVVCLERAYNNAQLSNSGQQGQEQHQQQQSMIWRWNTAQRPHTHDVRAMVIVPSSSSSAADDGTASYDKSATTTTTGTTMETLITGGVDTKLCSYVVPDFAKRRPQVWYPWPNQSPISTTRTIITTKSNNNDNNNKHHNNETESSKNKNNNSCDKLLTMQRSDRVEIYRLEDIEQNHDDANNKNMNKNNSNKTKTKTPIMIPKPASTLLGTIQTIPNNNNNNNNNNKKMIHHHLITSRLSSSGRWLAMCNAHTVYLFQLLRLDDDEDKVNDDEKTNTEEEEEEGETPAGTKATLQPIKVRIPSMLIQNYNVSFSTLRFYRDDALYVVDSKQNKVHILNLSKIRQQKSKGQQEEEEESEEGQDDDDDNDNDRMKSASSSSSSSVSLTLSKVTCTVALPRIKSKSATDDDIGQLPIHDIQISNDGTFFAVFRMVHDHPIHIFQKKTKQKLSLNDSNKKNNDDDDWSYIPFWSIPSLGGERPSAITFLDHYFYVPKKKKTSDVDDNISNDNEDNDDEDIGNNEENKKKTNNNNNNNNNVAKVVALAVATCTNQLYIFQVLQKRLSPWSEYNGFPISTLRQKNNHRHDGTRSSRWPFDLTCRKDIPIRLTINPQKPNQLIMMSTGAFCIIDLNRKIPKECQMVPERHMRHRKRRLSSSSSSSPEGNKGEEIEAASSDVAAGEGDSAQDGGVTGSDDTKKRDVNNTTPSCTICLHYNSMLYMDFIGPGQMAVVEQPWLKVISHFPEPLQRRVYGVN